MLLNLVCLVTCIICITGSFWKEWVSCKFCQPWIDEPQLTIGVSHPRSDLISWLDNIISVVSRSLILVGFNQILAGWSVTLITLRSSNIAYWNWLKLPINGRLNVWCLINGIAKENSPKIIPFIDSRLTVNAMHFLRSRSPCHGFAMGSAKRHAVHRSDTAALHARTKRCYIFFTWF